MHPRLQQAIDNDDVDALYTLIGEERTLLDHASEDPFPNTPLHVAAVAGKTDVAMEMAILKPSFTRMLNHEGYSPMLLALQHNRYHTARALIMLDPKLIRVRGRRGITPLHYVAAKEGDNELELLAEFLSACGLSIEDVTNRCETAFHVAVKSHNLKAFKVLFGWLKRVCRTEILDWKDHDGNTVLHIAASEEQLEIIKLLIGRVNVNAKNFMGKTALKIFQENGGDQDVAKTLQRQEHSTPSLSLSQFFSTGLTCFERYSYYLGIQDASARNIILVVSSLIATATYQAALTPPGGYWQDSSSNPLANSSSVVIANSSGIAVEKPHEAGNVILGGHHLHWFMGYNCMAFLVSVGTVWAIAFPLLPSTFAVYMSICVLCPAYFLSLTVQIPKHDRLLGGDLSILYLCSLVAVVVLPLLLWYKHKGVRKRIDATGKHVDNFLGSKDWK